MDIENPSTAVQARNLRLLIRDNRTKGIEVWHKNAKNFFLRGGQFVDAIKRQECGVNSRMEDALEEIEKYQERKESERKEALRQQRSAELEPYAEFVPFGIDLANMSDDEFAKLLKGAKLQFEADQAEKKAAEEARIEAERIARVANENRMALMPYCHWIENFDSLVFAELNSDAVQSLIDGAMESKQKEADEKAKAEAEAEALRKAAAERESEIQKERKQAEEKARLEREALQKKLDEERAAREKQEREAAQLKAKQEAEEKARKEAERKAANAPEKEKLKALANQIASIQLPAVQTEEAKAIAANVQQLLDKVVNYINEKSEAL
jgi:hypothetical protein